MNDQAWQAFEAALVVGWPDQDPLPPSVMAGWRTILEGIPPEQLMLAVRSFVTSGDRFRPNVGQLLRKARELADPIPTAAEVFDELVAKANRTVPPEEITWSHPVVLEVAKRLGWSRFCTASADDSSWRYAVRELHEALSERHRQALAGLASSINTTQRLALEGQT